MIHRQEGVRQALLFRCETAARSVSACWYARAARSFPGQLPLTMLQSSGLSACVSADKPGCAGKKHFFLQVMCLRVGKAMA